WLSCGLPSCSTRVGRHIDGVPCRRPVAHPPRLRSERPAEVPLWKVMVGPRADKLKTGPARVRFFSLEPFQLRDVSQSGCDATRDCATRHPIGHCVAGATKRATQ